MKRLAILLTLTLAFFSLLSAPIRDSLAYRSIQFSGGNEAVEVAYLESTGEQYLLFPEAIDGIDCYILPQRNIYYNIGQSVGRFNGGSRCDAIVFVTVGNGGLCVHNGSNSSSAVTYDLSRDHLFHVIVHGTAVEVDDIDYTMGTAWSRFSDFRNAPFALFGSYRADTKVVRTQSCRIGRCALYVGDELLYDLIPMRKGREGFFYDQVSGTTFTNDGTGDFIVGPDLAPLDL